MKGQKEDPVQNVELIDKIEISDVKGIY